MSFNDLSAGKTISILHRHCTKPKELISDNTKSINLLISRAKENDDKMLAIMGGNNTDENKQENSQPLPDNK